MASNTLDALRTLEQARLDRPGLRGLTLAWAAINAVQFVVWAAISVLTLHLGSPWWLWSFAIPGAALAGAWRFTSPNRQPIRS